ncbi:Rpn family recombination-promoting nuclease/putative transposase [Clostridium butyricum]|uniref:Rpn family recombination-promoting nuclease/putative transposase n=1 Tax=Clostridium butyricum TaxID=1492 RepID=UPI0018A9B659|nr:Rpn family recombination-promoting nuclease/putative transposase [Clostridium butyricum]MDB2158103.1 Rpn family recombination-promoting nuclease/putative transposase [Clostridium butyricum]
MSRRLLNPKVDFIFKKIFGSENHPNILISFLNAVMKPVDKIVSVVINNTEITKDFLEDKFSRLDVKATTNKGKIINIEIQIKTEYNMIKRSLYYWSKLYEEQLSEGDKYETLSRTVCINILDFKYLDNDRFHNGYRLKELETNEELTDIQEIHFIEIPKLQDLDDDENIDTIDMLTAWVEFLKDPESNVVRRLEFINEEIKEAKDELYRLSRDKKELELYNLRKKSFYDKISALSNAEKKGREEGKLLERINIAKNLLDVLDNETISLKTGLSVEEIEKLR